MSNPTLIALQRMALLGNAVAGVAVQLRLGPDGLTIDGTGASGFSVARMIGWTALSHLPETAWEEGGTLDMEVADIVSRVLSHRAAGVVSHPGPNLSHVVEAQVAATPGAPASSSTGAERVLRDDAAMR